MGLSSTAMIALAAASLIPEITLTIAATPCDFVMEGTIQDNLDGAKERPAGESSLMYRGQSLPFLPYSYRHPEYWQRVAEEGKKRGDMLAAIDMFEDSEQKHPIQEEEFIKVENIKGHLLLIGARDDVMWNTAKYIERMAARLASRPHSCSYETMIFDHGTHFVFPEAKGYTAECRKSRLEIEKRVLELCGK